MKLVLVRHAEARVQQIDAERSLTPQGWKQAATTAEWLRIQLGNETSVQIFASPYRRAQETGGCIAAALNCSLQTLADITPDTDARHALAALEAVATAETVVVVTHMPLAATLSQWLEAGVLSSAQNFMLAEARVLELEVLGPALAIRQQQFMPDDIE